VGCGASSGRNLTAGAAGAPRDGTTCDNSA
jgi:hypothetical protein